MAVGLLPNYFICMFIYSQMLFYLNFEESQLQITHLINDHIHLLVNLSIFLLQILLASHTKISNFSLEIHFKNNQAYLYNINQRHFKQMSKRLIKLYVLIYTQFFGIDTDKSIKILAVHLITMQLTKIMKKFSIMAYIKKYFIKNNHKQITWQIGK